MVAAEALRLEMSSFLRARSLPDDSDLSPLDFREIRSKYSSKKCLDSNTDVSAYMKIVMFNMISANSLRVLNLPVDRLRLHTPVDFRPTNLFADEFEAYTVTREMHSDITDIYSTMSHVLDPHRAVLVAYSDGLFSGLPLP